MANQAVCVAILFLGAFSMISALSKGQGYEGCFTVDNFPVDGQLVNGQRLPTYQSASMTVAFCQEICLGASDYYAALYNGDRCVCTSGYGGSATSCNKAAADGLEAGDTNALSIYSTGKTIGAGYDTDLCLSDLVMDGVTVTLSNNAPAVCQSYCAERQYIYAGISNGNQCQCGNNLVSEGWGSNCWSSTCSGLFTATCGGSSQTELLTSGYWGCFVDSPSRTLPNQVALSSYTVEACQNGCWEAGYQYAGLQDGNQCFCGDLQSTQQLTAASPSTCNIACSGDSTQICGGPWRNSVYGATRTSHTTESSAPADWQVITS